MRRGSKLQGDNPETYNIRLNQNFLFRNDNYSYTSSSELTEKSDSR